MPVSDDLEATISRVHERTGAAVVRIGRGPGRGTGVVVAAGVVVTNAHNVRGSATTITFGDGRSTTGSVRGVDGDGDLAAIAVDTGDLGPVPIEDAGPVRVGRPVFAVAAMPGGGARTTFGTVSAVAQAFRGPGGRLVTGAIEHTAPLGAGSSGGPLVDGDGRLLGLNTHRLGDGLYLAIPATEALERQLADLAAGTSPRRPRLGVAVVPGRAARRLRSAVGLPERDGVLLAGVDDGGPGHRAGLRKGDLIVAVDGTAVASGDDLVTVLAAISGPVAVLHVVRQVDELEVEVTFDEASAPGGATA